MTSVLRRLALWLSIAACGAVTASAAQQPAPQQKPASPPPAKAAVPARATVPAPAATPKFLAGRVDALAKAFSGRVGIAVRAVDDGWSTGWREDELFPQQSVSKMWVAITALDAADKGRVKMSEKVSLAKGDLTLFHQPIASRSALKPRSDPSLSAKSLKARLASAPFPYVPNRLAGRHTLANASPGALNLRSGSAPNEPLSFFDQRVRPNPEACASVSAIGRLPLGYGADSDG